MRKMIGKFLCSRGIHAWVLDKVEGGPGCLAKGHTDVDLYMEPTHAVDTYKCKREGCMWSTFRCNFFARALDPERY